MFLQICFASFRTLIVGWFQRALPWHNSLWIPYPATQRALCDLRRLNLNRSTKNWKWYAFTKQQRQQIDVEEEVVLNRADNSFEVEAGCMEFLIALSLHRPVVNKDTFDITFDLFCYDCELEHDSPFAFQDFTRAWLFLLTTPITLCSYWT
jgi:hypothetical protein